VPYVQIKSKCGSKRGDLSYVCVGIFFQILKGTSIGNIGTKISEISSHARFHETVACGEWRM